MSPVPRADPAMSRAATAAGDFVSLLTKSGSNNSYCGIAGDTVTLTGLVSPFTYMYPL